MQPTNRYSFTRLAVTWRLSIMLASSNTKEMEITKETKKKQGHKEEEKPRREQNEKRKRRETTMKTF